MEIITLQSLFLDTNILTNKDKKKLAPYSVEECINIVNILNGSTVDLLLEISSKYGHLEIVKFLIKNGATINDTKALKHSAKNGHLEIVKILVENGANINITNALVVSAENGHFEIVKFLVENGANNTDNFIFAQLCAAENGHFEIVKFLVENGSPITTFLLKYCLMNYHYDIVKFLVEKYTNIEDSKFTLMYSTHFGHLEIVKFIVKKYLSEGKKIPDECITKEINDINKFLFLYTSKDQEILFSEEIVSSLSPLKLY